MDKKESLSEEQIEQLLGRIGDIPQPPGDMRERVKSQVESAWRDNVQEQQQKWQNYGLFAAAATITLAITVGWLMTSEPLPQPVIASLDSPLESVMTSTDGDRWQASANLDMQQGAYVRAMDTASLSLTNTLNIRMKPESVVYLSSTDEVRLISGEIYLDSYEKPKDESFRVVTNFGIAEDIGTQFSVATSAAGWQIQVREGLVQVKDDATQVQLTESDRLNITATNRVSQSTLPAHHESWQWVENSRPVYDIEGESVDEYLQWVARETGRDLQYMSNVARESAKTTLLHGSITGMTASKSVQTVLPATNFELMPSRENVIIVNKR